MNTYDLHRSTPGKQGVDARSIVNFINAIEKDAAEKSSQELHSFMIVRHGYVVTEGWWSPYEAKMPHMLFSLSKSFTSTAIGMAVDEGILNLDDKVCSFFKEELPESISQNLSSMKIRHLLSMSTGHSKDTMDALFVQPEGNWIKGFLIQPVDYEPGTHFLYNTGATYMLSAILQKKTGLTLVEYLKPRLFNPLHIENPAWDKCPKGINTGGFGLNITTEDIAKLGQLYLQKGVWEGKRLISEKWVDEATKYQIDNSKTGTLDWAQGYGYQFWRCRNNAFRGDGAFGQYCIVIPDKDAVIAITGGVSDMQLPLNHVFEHLLPGFIDGEFESQEEEENALRSKLTELGVHNRENQTINFKEYSGCKYKLENNPFDFSEIGLNFEEDNYFVELKTNENEFKLNYELHKWLEMDRFIINHINSVSHGMPLTSRIFTRGTIIDDKSFEIIIRFVETPFYQKVLVFFDNKGIEIRININLGFENPQPMIIKGVVLNS